MKNRFLFFALTALLVLGTMNSCEKEVEEPKDIAVTGVSLNKTALSLAEGASGTLTATVAPENATDKAVAWSSSDSTVASVDDSGKVTALEAGTVVIVVTTADGGKTATCTVTVTGEGEPGEPGEPGGDGPVALEDYDVLKNYVNRASTPNFKVGSGVDVQSFLNTGSKVHTVTVANFDEVTAGNAMKYASVVGGTGAINTTNVTNFVHRAREAGTTIYGHTLLWHAQQQPTYLKSLIMYEIAQQDFETDNASNYRNDWAGNAVLGFTATGGGAGGTGRALTVTNSAERKNDYDAQFFFTIPLAKADKSYDFSIDIRADQATSFTTQAHSTPGSYMTSLQTLDVTTEWKTFKFADIFGENGTAVDGMGTIAFDLGSTATTYYFDNIKWSEDFGSDDAIEKITNGGFETDDATNYVAQNGGTTLSYTAEGKTGRAVKVTNPAVQTDEWGSQFIVFWDEVMKTGENYDFTIDIRADAPATISTQAQTVPGTYLSGMNNLSITTDWKTFRAADLFPNGNAVAGMGAIAFNLGKTATSFYFDNLSLVKGHDVMLPEAEVKAKLTAELERWIGGMMEATEGYVTAWDVVNEPMSDGNTYELKTTPASPNNGEFYWQDYLGQDFARVAIRIAREKYAEQGNPEPLKLFINDYNLEAAYNNNDKARGLIAMVEYWESDGVTVVDGIGTQMHVTYSMNAAEQKRQEDAVVQMYQLLAATGKLIKISELDMGLKDASGNTVTTANVTAEQHQKMAEYYKFIVGKYVEIIPPAQQYGITQWAATDSPSNSGWRANEPIGIYDLNYNRKPAYAGFADGLAGK
ncbi:MAG: endo-1,4-beta-xylanase [Rikenellaceae bacterium]|jgi:GH35 family endo-1,4-beta-xylanase|nr:endo-1,4-beta-xylanase [Rikenellaceae bacterium]